LPLTDLMVHCLFEKNWRISNAGLKMNCCQEKNTSDPSQIETHAVYWERAPHSMGPLNPSGIDVPWCNRTHSRLMGTKMNHATIYASRVFSARRLSTWAIRRCGFRRTSARKLSNLRECLSAVSKVGLRASAGAGGPFCSRSHHVVQSTFVLWKD